LRFLADQNVEEPVVTALRHAGHDVLQLAETLPVRAIDELILRRAREEDRILLTNDKDFGELTFLQRRATAGVVLVRMPSADSRRKAEKLLEVVARIGGRLSGAMVVVTERGVRRRPFPPLVRT
jgi:predicted nuclease of predicted toxin-antitoxin system